MILLFTDYGPAGPYVGQMHLVLRRLAPEVPIVDLQHDAPAFRPDLAGYLLAAHLAWAEPGDVVVAVVDPGVGTDRAPLALRLDGIWLVGPDNGLFEPALRRAREIECHHIRWRPRRLSASFHGRDLFAPVAARLARGDRSALGPGEPTRMPHVPEDLPAVVYLDPYGNAVTGLRAARFPASARLRVGERILVRARTFAEVPQGSPFCYENSSGLLEIAANRASAAEMLGLRLGDAVEIVAADC
ncbi:MAG: SAM-dependent chlorinase/fluorinase [Geminicoccaceae bacterium]|nr:SAM-dependent chlorinase/fluorinase [Geminicoccaceae bacterium]MCS7266914.1 SAM-dependent chlorinase/fluorinase [Geminicoccaceae bacterium]MDW8124162.1 SAM-dependent chlorinase/fluorinase [Geminicoccaceae bacterium]MDW8340615.1 SAM-dependent chlorinase/fluorinase [Geminicoccaceae bacterium]